jgi:hypothetical protein
MALDGLSEYGHPAWLTAVSTAVAYGVVLLGMFAALFLVPYALFVLL